MEPKLPGVSRSDLYCQIEKLKVEKQQLRLELHDVRSRLDEDYEISGPIPAVRKQLDAGRPQGGTWKPLVG